MSLALNIAHASVILAGVLIFWLARPGSSLFSYHPALMSIGTIVFAFESVLLLIDKRVPRRKRVFIHWLVSVIGTVITLLAFQAVYRVKNYNDKPHFSTWHGLFGIIAISLLVLQNLGGIPTKYSRQAMAVTGIHKKRIKKLHDIGSIMFGSCTSATIITAFYSTWFVETTGGGVLWWALVGMIMLPRAFFVYSKKKWEANKAKYKAQNKGKEIGTDGKKIKSS